MKKFIHKLYDIGQIVVIISLILLLFGIILKILQPLSPIITVLIVLFFTLWTLNKWTNAMLSIGGIMFYAISWPIAETWGTLPAMFIFTFAVISWMIAVYSSVSNAVAPERIR